MLTSRSQHTYAQETYHPEMDSLAARVISSRQAAGLRQEDLAAACGIDRAAVAGWERGSTKSINSNHLFPAARRLGVDPEWLATGIHQPGVAVAVAEPGSSYNSLPAFVVRLQSLVAQLRDGDSEFGESLSRLLQAYLRRVNQA